MNACIVAVTSDLHTNSTIGLCPPRFTLDAGDEHTAGPVQRWLWRNWLDYWQTIDQLKQDSGLPVVWINNGDAFDGDHHNTTEIITRNEADQLRLAVEVVTPALAVADRVFIIRGTEAHTGKQAWREEKLAADIGAEKSPTGTASWWHLYASFGGVTFDVQHHPESGSMRPWTRGGEVNRIAAMLLYEYAGTGHKPPNVALRAHKHGFLDSGTTHLTRVFQTPPWQLSTAFGHRLGVGGKINSVGGLYFICRNGSYTFDQIMYQPKRAQPYRVEL